MFSELPEVKCRPSSGADPLRNSFCSLDSRGKREKNYRMAGREKKKQKVITN